MNKKFKKICSMALTLAITATSAVSMSVSAYTDKSNFAGCTIIDDKGMMKNNDNENYKIIYDNQWNDLIKARLFYNHAEFVLSEDVNYEEVNDRIIEIFKEFYPNNYLDVSPNGMSEDEYEEYLKNYKPNLWSHTNTVDGVTTYTLRDDAKEKKSSKAFMEKLNEEKLISAFYDFGEVYYRAGRYWVNLIYSLDVDIDLIYKYIEEHNIDCTVKKNDYRYELEFNDDTSELEQFLTAVDIYEETSIKVDNWFVCDSFGDFYGKNSLEDLKEEPTEPATEPTTEATTEPTTTTTTTTEKATEATTTTSTTVSTTETTLSTTTTEATSQTTAATTAITTTTNIIGDANGDNKLDIRDAAFIAQKLAKRIVEVNTEYKLESKNDELPAWADYNNDGVCDIRDAAAIARDLASKKIR